MSITTLNHYQVIPGQFFAGECPFEHPQSLHELYAMGIDVIVSLREELNPHMASEFIESQGLALSIYHVPIADFDIPTNQQMIVLMSIINSSLKEKKSLYLSCAHGLGRTGVVIASFLAEHHGISGTDALGMMTDLRMRYGFRVESSSPETQEQIQFVINQVFQDFA